MLREEEIRLLEARIAQQRQALTEVAQTKPGLYLAAVGSLYWLVDCHGHGGHYQSHCWGGYPRTGNEKNWDGI